HNAATHTPRGTPVEISARVEDKQLVVEVADRGPGIASEDLEHVFEMFRRRTSGKTSGIGLGLAIVKGFIEAQGGSVRADNRPGGGAVFSLSLPLSEAPELVEEPA